jgi:hypothetical protein
MTNALHGRARALVVVLLCDGGGVMGFGAGSRSAGCRRDFDTNFPGRAYARATGGTHAFACNLPIIFLFFLISVWVCQHDPPELPRHICQHDPLYEPMGIYPGGS